MLILLLIDKFATPVWDVYDWNSGVVLLHLGVSYYYGVMTTTAFSILENLSVRPAAEKATVFAMVRTALRVPR